MDQRKRPRPPPVEPDFVSFPQAREQARCAGPGMASEVGELHPADAASLPPRMSTRVSIHGARHAFNCYDTDTWTEVAKHLCGRELLRLSGTSRWFRGFLTDDTLWRYAFRDLNLAATNPNSERPPHCSSWRHLYLATFNGSHAYWFREMDRHIDAWRLGAFLLDCDDLLLSVKLPMTNWSPLQADVVKHDIQTTGTCVVTNARHGVWIADFHYIRCSGCNFKNCQGVLQVLDAHHSDAFMEKAYRDGRLEYEDLGEHVVREMSSASFGVFNLEKLTPLSASCFLDTTVWTSTKALHLKIIVGTYAAAIVDCNLCLNEGIRSSFQAMRDTATDGKILSVRISQSLL